MKFRLHYKPRNREKVKASKRGKYWCDHCDAALVHDGEKCSKCAIRNKRKTLKKYYIDGD
jgi:hypothetical protein